MTMLKYLLIGTSIGFIIKIIIYLTKNHDLKSTFKKIKKLIIKDKLYYPGIDNIFLDSDYNIADCTNLAINKKIKELVKQTHKSSWDCQRPFEELEFFKNFKIMKVIYDNFYHGDVIKSNTKIIFHDAEWYEMSYNILYLDIINNVDINLDNLETGIKELTIVGVNTSLNNLPPTLKKLYLYDIDKLFDMRTLKIPTECELYVESCAINKDKFV
jgi:hypothetical protein